MQIGTDLDEVFVSKAWLRLFALTFFFILILAYLFGKPKWQSNQSTLPKAFQKGKVFTQMVITGDTKMRFSAVSMIDALYQARDQKQEFLDIYLSRHFPKDINRTDIGWLREAIQKQKSTSKISTALEFRLGTLYFFLAVANTQLIARGAQVDSQAVWQNWLESLMHFKNAKEVGKMMAEEIQEIVKRFDLNQSGQLEEPELASFPH